MHVNAKRGLFFTPPEQFTSPTWVPHLHGNRALLILTGRMRTVDVFPVVACLPPIREGPLEKLWGEEGGRGGGNFRAAGIFFPYQIPCMNFFQALA